MRARSLSVRGVVLLALGTLPERRQCKPFSEKTVAGVVERIQGWADAGVFGKALPVIDARLGARAEGAAAIARLAALAAGAGSGRVGREAISAAAVKHHLRAALRDHARGVAPRGLPPLPSVVRG